MYQSYYAKYPPEIEDLGEGEDFLIKPFGSTHSVAVSEATLGKFVLVAQEALAKRRLGRLNHADILPFRLKRMR